MKIFLTLVSKEIREHFRWTLLLAVIVLAAMAYGMRAYSTFSYQVSVFGRTFNLVTTFGFPLVAGVLGLLATVFESKGDHWAFLIHKPVSPLKLFWGKLTGAFVLYLLATLVPHMLVTIWVSKPENYAFPFQWAMALPGLAGILVGAVFLPAAFTLGLSQSTWQVARLLPLGLGLFCAGLVGMYAFEFRHAVLIWLPFFALSILCAQHVFITGVVTPSRPFWSGASRLLYSLTLLTGLWGILTFTLDSLPAFPPGPPYPAYHAYYLTHQGEPLHYILYSGQVTLKDLTGKTIAQWDERRYPEEYTRHFLDRGAGFSKDPLIYGTQVSYSNSARYFYRFDAIANEAWFYLPDTRVIQGYAPRPPKHPLGHFGPAGFSKPGGTPTPGFPGRLLAVHAYINNTAFNYVAFTSGVYLMDFDAPSADAPTFLCDPGESILITGENGSDNPTGSSNSPQSLLVITDRRLLLFNSDRKLTFQTPFTLPPVPISFLELHRLGDQLIFSVVPSTDAYERPSYLIRVDLKTSIASPPQALPPLPPYIPPTPTLKNALTGVAMGPLGSIAAYAHRTPGNLFAGPLPWTALSALIGLVTCLLLTIKHRSSKPSRIFWAIGGAVLGIPGILLMLALWQKPQRQPCPACSKPRPLSSPLCPACHAPFTPPAPNGTEVFAPLT